MPEITGHENKFFRILSVNYFVDNVLEAIERSEMNRLAFLANLRESFTVSTSFMLNKAYTITGDDSSDFLLIAQIFPWMHFAAGPILPMAQYISVVK